MKVLLLFSGGIDSTFLLHELLAKTVGSRKRPNPVKEVVCLSFTYGQPHADKELTAAKAITDKLGVKHLFEKLDFPFLKQDMAGANPVVPNRNMILLAVAGAIAEVHNCKAINIGCTQSDFETFPDCRPFFLRQMNEAMLLVNSIHIIAPLVGKSKADIVQAGKAHGIDWGETWSCYAPQWQSAKNYQPCGECLACKERAASGV